MAAGMLSTRWNQKRNVLNGDTEGHILTGDNLEDG